MAQKSPEQELADFLDSQPSWRRKLLQWQFDDWTGEDLRDWCNRSLAETDAAQAQYLELLQRVPSKWREYRARRKKSALNSVPSAKAGRPRKDALAIEAAELHRQNKSYGQIATALNAQYGPGTTTKEAVRKLLTSRRRLGAEKKR